ncbi:MAG: aminotransferase class V-fold PLP-dependent enzyme [Phycisphaerae bacterium]
MGRRLADDLTALLESESDDPVLPRVRGAELHELFDEPPPRAGCAPEVWLDACRQLIIPHNRRNGHPRFFAYVCSSADPIGVLADALASAMNQNVTSWRSAPAATEIERLVIRWLDELLGFDGDGHGMFVSGGSSANAAGIACALMNANRAGQSPPREAMTVYVSPEGHLSLVKAARLLGVRDEHIRRPSIDDARRMMPDALERMIAEDRDAGRVPVCVCASAGTTNTGAIDPLEQIADVCGRCGVWLHIDGAYGAPAAMTDDYAWLKRGFARADSLSIDPHKWLFAPIDAGCVLFRDAGATRRAFNVESEYTRTTRTEPVERFAFFDHGSEMSRRFRALKVWAILKVRGTDAIARIIQRNIDLRRQLDARINAEPRLESLGGDLSITCFRYRPAHVADDAALNAFNQRVLETLVAEGRLLMSPTTLDGRFALRACIVNFRTTAQDVDFLLDEVLRVGTVLHHAPRTGA